MTEYNQTSQNETGFEVAVIGMAGRFPGSPDIEHFWENLKNGKETISFFTQEESLAAGIKQQILSNPNYVNARGLLEDQEYFDSVFFNYTPIESEFMDPQVRIFHQCCWHALEHAGYDPSTYSQLIGLYAGASTAINWEAYNLLSDRANTLMGYAATYLRKDYLCTRISYKLGLKGPSFYLQTACSTSLVALHLACQALINSECRMALAGGVSLTHQGKTGYVYQEGMIGSRDGHCRAFDDKASGTIRGEGAGVVVLKMLNRAKKDRDTIHAVIKGTAINNDGDRKVGFTAPSITGQAEVIWAALQMAEIEPETVTYIETHGTGTRLGDPVEINALKKVFKNNKKHSIALGAVKTNIGHLDTAAGAAGLIKTIMAMKHRLIPPTLHFEHPNPEIDFANSPFYVNAALSPWEPSNLPMRAGISSFGIGGTNAHAIIEAPPKPQPSSSSREHQLLLISAQSEGALDRNTRHLVEYFKNNQGVNLADATYTLKVGRKSLRFRRMGVCSSSLSPVNVLTNPDLPPFTQHLEKDYRPKAVFMFPGQGSQYVNMGIQLYKEEPVFRKEMERCFQVLNTLSGTNFKEILYPSASNTPAIDINETQYTQPLLFIIEYALSKQLMHWGIQPFAMIGHSIGEYVAAHLSNVFSLEDALKLVLKRGQLMQQIPSGAMLSVPLSPDELVNYLTPALSIAAVNTGSRCVVSGTHEDINALQLTLKEKGIEARALHTSHAFHSSMMEPILEPFIELVKTITLNTPETPYISNVTGTWITPADAMSPAYWATHLRQTVQFAGGASQLLQNQDALFIEIGPGKTLSTFIMQHKERNPRHISINLMRHPDDTQTDTYFLLNKIGQLWAYGVIIDWKNFYENETRNRIPLPLYSFDTYPYPAVVNFWNLSTSYSQTPQPGQDAMNSDQLKQSGDMGAAPIQSSSSLRPRPSLGTPYTPPQDETEKAIASLFQQFFGVGPIGVLDNFYELGGDSLNSVQLANLIRKSDFQVTFQDLLSLQNIREISRKLKLTPKQGQTLDMQTVTGKLSEKYGMPVLYRTYSLQNMEYRVLIIISDTSMNNSIATVFEDIAALLPGEAITYPNFIVFITSGDIIPPSGTIDEKEFNGFLQLKETVEDTDRKNILLELKPNDSYTEKLKQGEKTLSYPVSPVQSVHLIPPYHSIAANFIYYSHDFTFPVHKDQIESMVNRLIDIHPLLRSVIIPNNTGHLIEEYMGVEPLSIPYIDISSYGPSCKNEIATIISRALRQPITVIDHVLFRLAILKIDHCYYKLVWMFNHLVFDGTSVGIIENQVRELTKRNEIETEANQSSVEVNALQTTTIHYKDYVEFMKSRDYSEIRFENYVNTNVYLESCGEISAKFPIGSMKTEVFDLDISIIPEEFKNHYEEIMLLTYAGLIRELIGIPHSPITFVSNGRVYKDATFNNIIGEFPDEIPVLFSFQDSLSPREMMDKYTEYKRFIRENNFNFYNYVTRGYMGEKGRGIKLSPFIFNSLIGSYDLLMRIRGEEAQMQGTMPHVPIPFFYLGVLEDYYAGKVGIRLIQNTRNPLQETFINNYTELIRKL